MRAIKKREKKMGDYWLLVLLRTLCFLMRYTKLNERDDKWEKGLETRGAQYGCLPDSFDIRYI